MCVLITGQRLAAVKERRPYLVRDLVASLLTSQSLYYSSHTTSLPAALPPLAPLLAQCWGASEVLCASPDGCLNQVIRLLSLSPPEF